MINLLTKVKIVDNSGAILGRTIKVKTKNAKIGDKILISVKRISSAGSILKGDVFTGIIVRTNYKKRFEDNAVILIKKDGSPVGSRIKGPISNKIKDRKIRAMSKILI
jgi:large subunit ribosomal protein L14